MEDRAIYQMVNGTHDRYCSRLVKIKRRKDKRGKKTTGEGEGTRGGKGVGRVRTGDEMVIGTSCLSLKANNHSHDHSTYFETKCVSSTAPGCVWSILFASSLSINVYAASSKEQGMISLYNTCMYLGITSHVSLFSVYNVKKDKHTHVHPGQVASF